MTDTIEIEREKVATMVHQLTLTAERGHMPPVSQEHVETARDWLVEAMDDQPPE